MGQYYYPTILHKDKFVSLTWKTERIPKPFKEVEWVGLKEWEKWVNNGIDISYPLLLGYAAQNDSTIDEAPVLKEPFALLGDYHKEAGKTREWVEVSPYTKITKHEHMWVAVYSDYVLFIPVMKSNLLSMLLTTSNGGGGGDVFHKYTPPAIPEAFTITSPEDTDHILEVFKKRHGVIIFDDRPVIEREDDDDALAALASQYREAVMNGFRHLVVFLLEYDFRFHI